MGEKELYCSSDASLEATQPQLKLEYQSTNTVKECKTLLKAYFLAFIAIVTKHMLLVQKNRQNNFQYRNIKL